MMFNRFKARRACAKKPATNAGTRKTGIPKVSTKK